MEQILIVEDSPTQREMLRHTLEGQGYAVTIAINGKDAWARFREIAPTLVITDIIMPEMDGYALCREIKRTPDLAHIPVVLLTSLSDPRDVITGLECGADSFVGKPFAEDYLLSRIQHVIANRDLPEREKGEPGIEISHEGRLHLITAERPQILNLLLSVYEVAVRRNEDLIQAQAKLRKLNGELEQKVRDRTQKLEESNRSLETFCYSIAHDLRAPLRGIQGYVNILREEYAPQMDEQAQEYAGRACTAAARMDRMISDLLAYGRISHGEAPMRQLDIEEEFRQVIADMSDQIKAKDAVVELDVKVSRVWASRILLTQILINLLGNSLKFVRPDAQPRIQLQAEQDGDRIKIMVTDNGIGIAPIYREKIFNVFEKAHTEQSYPGTGIGLAIVQKAVERMGGTIRMDDAPGGGARFTFYLPARQPAVG
ncbi:MAG: response regulator [Verrucomicrobiota bacterium]